MVDVPPNRSSSLAARENGVSKLLELHPHPRAEDAVRQAVGPGESVVAWCPFTVDELSVMKPQRVVLAVTNRSLWILSFKGKVSRGTLTITERERRPLNQLSAVSISEHLGNVVSPPYVAVAFNGTDG